MVMTHLGTNKTTYAEKSIKRENRIQIYPLETSITSFLLRQREQVQKGLRRVDVG